MALSAAPLGSQHCGLGEPNLCLSRSHEKASSDQPPFVLLCPAQILLILFGGCGVELTIQIQFALIIQHVDAITKMIQEAMVHEDLAVPGGPFQTGFKYEIDRKTAPN